jgi:hypothetical protein
MVNQIGVEPTTCGCLVRRSAAELLIPSTTKSLSKGQAYAYGNATRTGWVLQPIPQGQ